MSLLGSKRESKESSRFAARVSAEKKLRWQRAAAIRGHTMTEFVVNSADAEAERILKESEFMELTRRDRLAFVQALLKSPPAPNAKLRKAAERYAQLFPAS
jgi:uncharacterized protein (DUF1778 family)